MFDKEFIRRLAIGSALAAGVGAAGMFGAGAANALPGISYDAGPGDPIGIGDNSPNGAQANASNNNKALAISIFKPASATAVGQNRTGNNVFALDGHAGFLDHYTTHPYEDDHDNQVMAIGGTAMAHGEWTNVIAVGGRVSNRSDGAIYPDGGRTYVYSRAATVFPVPVRSTVIGVCGQRVTGNQDVFETSGNCVS